MIKLIGALLVIASAARIGFDFAARLETRRKSLICFKDICLILESEIEFMRTLPGKVFFSESKLQKGIMGEFLHQVYKLTEKNMSISQAWKTALFNSKARMCLTANDVKILCDFSDRIGKADISNEIKNIKNTVCKLEMQIREATDNCARKRLYRSGGILAGLMAAVLLM